MEIHSRRTCDASSLWSTSFTKPQALQQDAVSSSGHVAIEQGALRIWSLGQVRVNQHVEATTTNATTHLTVRVQFPQGDNVEALVAVHLPQLNVNMTMGVTAAADRQSDEVWVGSSRSTSVMAKLPCGQDIAAMVHDLEFVWDENWLRWQMDDVVLYEEPTDAHAKAAFRTLSASSTSLASSVRVNLSMNVQQSGKHPSPPPFFQIQSIDLKQSGDSNDGDACRPRYPSDANCREKTSFTPRLGANEGALSTSEIQSFIDETLKKIPDFAKLEQLGRSLQDRPLEALCVGACASKTAVPQVLYTGMHHSREPISMMNLVYTIDLLVIGLQNGDLQVLELLSSRQLWFVLVVNPDGYARNEEQKIWDSLDIYEVGQRKNTRPGCSKILENGVDLNRNYDVCFGVDDVGSSTNVCAEDYRGPAPFSEPETQAIRDLVERQGMDFSVALNYHSFGRYINIPFACEPQGLPAGEVNRTLFNDIAQEMARYNNFAYGQPWKDSNLYTVNGETSDWMWYKHGIIAMSPEVGPAFDMPSHLGFWPPQEDVPMLSLELYYMNLYAARVSGPIYTVDVDSLKLQDEYVQVELTLTNEGLRKPLNKIEVLGSAAPDGQTLSSKAKFVEPSKLGTKDFEPSTATKISLKIPRNESQSQAQEQIYVVLRDELSCHYYRVSIDSATSGFQLWLPLSLPRCGLCESFGKSNASMAASSNTRCDAWTDVTTPASIQLREVEKWIGVATPTSESPEHQTSGSSLSSRSSSSEADEIQSQVPKKLTPAPTSNTPVVSTATPVIVASSGYTALPASSKADAPITESPVIAATTADSTSTPIKWSSLSAMAIVPAMIIACVAIIYLCTRMRRRYQEGQGATSTATKPNKRTKGKYAKVVNEEATPTAQGSVGADNSQWSEDEEEAEFGRRQLSPTRRVRSPSPRRGQSILESGDHDDDAVV